MLLPRQVRDSVEGDDGVEPGIWKVERHYVGAQRLRAGRVLLGAANLLGRNVDGRDLRALGKRLGNGQARAAAQFEHLCARGWQRGEQRRQIVRANRRIDRPIQIAPGNAVISFANDSLAPVHHSSGMAASLARLTTASNIASVSTPVLV